MSHTSNSLNSKALHRWSYLKQNTVRTTFATSRLICTQFHQTAPFTNNSVIRCMLLHSVFSHFCQSLYAWSAMTLHMILSHQRFSAQLLPTSLAHIPARPSDSSAHKQLSPRNAIRNVQLSRRAWASLWSTNIAICRYSVLTHSHISLNAVTYSLLVHWWFMPRSQDSIGTLDSWNVRESLIIMRPFSA